MNDRQDDSVARMIERLKDELEYYLDKEKEGELSEGEIEDKQQIEECIEFLENPCEDEDE